MNLNEQIAQARRFSRYFQRICDADPALCEGLLLRQGAIWQADEMTAWLAGQDCSTPERLSSALRRLRHQVMAALMVRDLARGGDLAAVVEGCTLLAEVCIRHSLRAHDHWLAEIHGTPVDASGCPIELAVIGMGKLGGGELNVSSDIDLVYLYAEEGETSGRRSVTHHQYFVMLAQRLARSLSEVTAEGFVFRVDARLRPWGDSGPLAVSYDAFENYLVAHGREWERYAWVKGRAITGSRSDELVALIRPFVFRKYLDFGAISALRDLHAQIRREVVRRDRASNIKLGPGGIREVEFIAQVFQLIRGGQDTALQARPTLVVLDLLADRGLLQPQQVNYLREAYVFLRNLEHRLQYLDDAQTQMLPNAEQDRLHVAQAMGFADEAAFMQALEQHRQQVSECFATVFAGPEDQSDVDAWRALWMGLLEDRDALSQLSAAGYTSPDSLLQRLTETRRAGRYTTLPERSRDRFDALAAALLPLAGQFDQPDQTFGRVLDLLEAIAGRGAYLALLEEYPLTLKKVTSLCSASAWAAAYLTANPILLDELLDDATLDQEFDPEVFAANLARQLAHAEGDVERQMDVLRHFRHRQVFRFLVLDLTGHLPLPALAGGLTRLAEVILQAVLPLAWARVPGRHREVPRFAIIGYGKLGARELGYASDLDMVFLYDDDAPEAGSLYARLAQRVVGWLTTFTPAGMLYDTDLRLRPDGVSGLLVSSTDAFRDYQRSQAWTWEHQAITRARFVAGDPVIGSLFDAIRLEILQHPPGPALLADILDMRQRVHAGHRNDTDLFDVKHDAGGMIDIEFMVQYLVLRWSASHPELTENIGCVALLERAAQAGLIPQADAVAVGAAWQEYWRIQHALRLKGMDKARLPCHEVSAAVNTVTALWQALMH